MVRPYPIDDLLHIQTHVKDDLSRCRFFITGAGSWTGTWITQWLNFMGVEWARWEKPYIRFPSGKFDYVIHLAQHGTEKVIGFTRKHKASLLFTSSGSAHNPDPHAASDKLADEGLIQKSGLDYRIARMYTLIGPGDNTGRYVADKFIRQAVRGEPLEVYTPGSIRTFLYTADMVIWLLRILLHGEPRIYDVAGIEQASIYKFAEMVNRACGDKSELVVDKYKDDPPDIRPRYIPGGDHLRHSFELGLDAWIGLKEAIERTVRWHRQSST